MRSRLSEFSPECMYLQRLEGPSFTPIFRINLKEELPEVLGALPRSGLPRRFPSLLKCPHASTPLPLLRRLSTTSRSFPRGWVRCRGWRCAASPAARSRAFRRDWALRRRWRGCHWAATPSARSRRRTGMSISIQSTWTCCLDEDCAWLSLGGNPICSQPPPHRWVEEVAEKPDLAQCKQCRREHGRRWEAVPCACSRRYIQGT